VAPIPEDTDHLRRLRRRQIAGLLLLALAVLALAVARARWGDLFPPGWWRP
jgi:hypothetical protein